MQGWTQRADGLWLNDGVAASPEAQKRGGYLAYDAERHRLIEVPWSDGSGEQLSIEAQIPDGTVVGTMQLTDYGFHFPCTGPLISIDVVESNASTMWGVHSGLGEIPGVKIIWTMGISSIVDSGDGVWRPKRSKLSGGNFNVYVQPRSLVDYDEFGEIVGTRPEWAAGSLAVYGEESKVNNLYGPDGTRIHCYSTGKREHFYAHFAAFWDRDGRLLGRVTGWYEWDAEKSETVKCFAIADLAPYLATAKTVSIDDTLGNTNVGASVFGLTSRQFRSSGPFTAGSSFTATTFNLYANTSDFTNATFGCLYPNSGSNLPDGQSPVANSQSTDFPLAVDTNFKWYTGTYSSGPSIVSGNKYWITWIKKAAGTPHQARYDSTAGYSGLGISSSYTSPPDPCPATTLLTSNVKASAYLEGTGGGGGGTPTAVYQYLLRKRRTQ